MEEGGGEEKEGERETERPGKRECSAALPGLLLYPQISAASKKASS